MPKFIRPSPIIEGERFRGNDSPVFDTVTGLQMTAVDRSYVQTVPEVQIQFLQYNGQKIVDNAEGNEVDMWLRYTDNPQYLNGASNQIYDGSSLALDESFVSTPGDDNDGWLSTNSGIWADNFEGTILSWVRIDSDPNDSSTHSFFSISEINEVVDSTAFGSRIYFGVYIQSNVFSFYQGTPMVGPINEGYKADTPTIESIPGTYLISVDTKSGQCRVNGQLLGTIFNSPVSFPNSCRVKLLAGNIFFAGDGFGMYSFSMYRDTYFSAKQINQISKVGPQLSKSRLTL